MRSTEMRSVRGEALLQAQETRLVAIGEGVAPFPVFLGVEHFPHKLATVGRGEIAQASNFADCNFSVCELPEVAAGQ